MHWEHVQLLLLLKMIFSAVHKVQWQQFSGVVDSFENTYVHFFQKLCTKNYSCQRIFDGIIQKNKNVATFWDTVYVYKCEWHWVYTDILA